MTSFVRHLLIGLLVWCPVARGQPGPQTGSASGTASITGGNIANTNIIGSNISGGNQPISITAPPYNASTSNSSSANTTAIQSAINAAVSSGTPLLIPAPSGGGCYNYTPPLVISGNITIVGNYVAENWDGAINAPNGTPNLVGSVLCPSSNGSDAIDISGTSITVNVRDLGILFQTPYSGTGDAFHYIPGAISGGFNPGLSGSLWENVKVFGVDGNHYAFNFTNPIYDTFINIFGYGGGGLNIYGAGAGDFGNLVFVHPFFQVYVGGSANGFSLTGAGQLNSNLNLITMIRPQAIVQNQGGAYTPPSPSPATNSQYVFYQGTGVINIRLIAPDFESTVSAPVQLQANGNNTYDINSWLGGDVILNLNGTPVKQGALQSGQFIAAGGFNGTTSGSVTFDQAFPNGIYSVVCTGWGHTCQLNGAPTTTGFSYTQSANGQSYYVAYGY